MKPTIQPIYTEITECQDCYKCIRQCPVKAIQVKDGHAQIVADLCVLCGHCVQICPVGAKKVRNDIPRLRYLLENNTRVVVSLAPSYLSEWKECSSAQLIQGIKKLGFSAVSETAVGADIVSLKAAEDLNKTNKGLFISSACPTMVEYIKKYQKDLSPYVTEYYSPLLAHAQYLKSYYGEKTGVVFIGPCIAKKRESDQFSQILDLSLTFKDLKDLFEINHIVPSELKETSDDVFMPMDAGNGHFFPIDGGMIESIKSNNIDSSVRFLTFSGLPEMEKALEGAEALGKNNPCFMELLACRGGCVNGPGCGSEKGALLKQSIIEEQAWVKENPVKSDFSIAVDWAISPDEQTEFSEKEIDKVLFGIGKTSPQDELNCGSCGYNTCREFAAACLRGRAESRMCVSYLRRLSEKKANALMKSMPSGVVIVGSDLRLVDCNLQFANLLGEEAINVYFAKPGMEGAALGKLAPFTKDFAEVLTSGCQISDKTFHVGHRVLRGSIFPIEPQRVAGGIFQDVTNPWVQRDSITKQAKKVLEKNVATVQQIAYLLGENAAETEVMLNSIMTSFDSEEQEKI